MNHFIEKLQQMGVPMSQLGEYGRIAEEIQLQAGDFLEKRGNVTQHVYLLTRGVALCKTPLKLKDTGGFMLFGPNSWINESPAIFSVTAAFDMIALTECTAFKIKSLQYMELLKHQPCFASQMLRLAAFRICRLNTVSCVFKSASPAFRILYTLAHFSIAMSPANGFTSKSANDDFTEVFVSSELLSQMSNVSRTSFNYFVPELQKLRLLEHSYGRIRFIHENSVWLKFIKFLDEQPHICFDKNIAECIDLIMQVDRLH